MSLIFRWAVLAIVAILSLSAPAHAQRGAAAGGTIAGIQIQGNVRAEPETIRSYLQLKVGEPFDAAAADRSLKALFATGLFSDVVIEMQGSTLVVKVTENPIINRVAFEGNSKIEDDKLRDEVQSKPRQVYTRARVQADVDRILTIYRRSGRYNASVEPKVINLEQGRVDLVFEINEGDVTGVKRISFVGNEAFGDGTLRGKIRTSESAWWRFLSSDDRFDPDRLNLDRELLRKFYLSEGYADFRVVSAVAELAPNREGFFITFTISEGPRYKFGKVDVTSRFQGLDTDVLQTFLTIAQGDWYDADAVEKSVSNIQEAVGSLGYAFVEVRPNIRRNKDNDTVDVIFDVQEGPRVYVERINISGNTRTLDKVIRREFRLAEGDAFSTAKVRRSQQRLRNLGFFEKVDVSAAPGSSPDKTNLEVQVVEQSTGEISFGAGYSTTAGIVGDISIKERNLLGKGQEVRLGLSLGTLEHDDRLQLHRALLPGPNRSRPVSTSSGRRTIASRSPTTATAASALLCAAAGPTPRISGRSSVIRCGRRTSTTCQPGRRPSCRLRRVCTSFRRFPRRSCGIPVTSAAQHDEGIFAAQFDGGRRRHRNGAVRPHDRRRGILPESLASRMS